MTSKVLNGDARLFRIWPTVALDGVRLILIHMFVIPIVFLVAVSACTSLFERSIGLSYRHSLVYGIITGFVLTLGLIWICLWRRDEIHARKRFRARRRRLERVCAYQDANERLQHRVVELRLMRSRGAPSGLKRTIKMLPVNTLIWVNGPKRMDRSRLQLVTLGEPFEPSDVAGGSTNINELIANHQAEQGSEVRSIHDLSPERLPKFSVASNMAAALGILLIASITLGLLAVMIGLLFVGGRSIISGHFNSVAIFLIGILVAVFVVWGRQLLYGTKWWLVPQGIIIRKHAAWRRSLPTALLTRTNTPLVVGIGFVIARHGKQSVSLRLGKCSPEVLLASWLSDCPPPTQQEVLNFIGPNAKFL